MSSRLNAQRSTRTAGQRVAAELRAEMARQKRSQDELSRHLGISQAAVSRRLQGHAPIDIDELLRIADFLGREAADFLPVAS